MGVRAEACLRLNAVLVDDAKRTKLGVLIFCVPARPWSQVNIKLRTMDVHSRCKGEGMERLQPIVVGMAAVLA